MFFKNSQFHILDRYNNLKMSILDKVKIGNTVKVNLELSKDRLTKETIDALKISSECEISDFKITDGKGIGVVLKLANGKKQWFFENEIFIVGNPGESNENNTVIDENINPIFDNIKNTNYDKKHKISDLINPINFLTWLLVSFRDIF